MIDAWSLGHLGLAAALTVLIGPAWALAVMIAWEPIEIFAVSPLLARFGVRFGYEGWKNSMADIVFDIFGIVIGIGLLLPLWDPLHRIP